MAATESVMIDVTPTWPEAMRMLVAIMEAGTSEGKKTAREEMMRCARIAQAAMESDKRERAMVALLQDTDTRVKLAEAMRERGGSFVAALAGAITRADLSNLACIAVGFTDSGIFDSYMPAANKTDLCNAPSSYFVDDDVNARLQREMTDRD